MDTKMGELKCQINMTLIVPQKLLGLQNGKWKNLSNHALSEKGERDNRNQFEQTWSARKSIKDNSIKELMEVETNVL